MSADVTRSKTQRSALVTGATGFVGPNLVAGLLDRGWKVALLVRPSTSLERVERFKDDVTVHTDFGGMEELVHAVGEIRPDVCFHLATNFVGVHQRKDVDALIASNITFGTRLLEALASLGNCLVVNTGTAWQHFESRSYSPTSLYAATKQAFRDIAQYYAEAGLLKVVNLVLFDTYGPDDPRQKLVPLLMNAVARDQPLEMSPGGQLIDLVYIDDVVSAFLRTAEIGSTASESILDYAVSSAAPVSIKALVAQLEEVAQETIPVTWGAKSYRQREMLTPWTAGAILPGWSPNVDLAEGLRRVWDWRQGR